MVVASLEIKLFDLKLIVFNDQSFGAFFSLVCVTSSTDHLIVYYSCVYFDQIVKKEQQPQQQQQTSRINISTNKEV